MNVSDLGEFALIDRLAAVVGAQRPESLILGIGDDAAAWRSGDSVVLATTDTLIAGVHFLADRTPWDDLGWKALAVNVSDIAAMGGEPQFALITLGLPPDTPVAGVDDLYAGLNQCAVEYGVAIVGGDVVRAPEAIITVALIGRAHLDEHGRPLLLRRDAAQAGDLLAVTGTLGDSAAGLRCLRSYERPSGREGAPRDDAFVRAHLRPRPPLAAAQQAARLGLAAAIDISDGLLQDLGHICRLSRLGATVRAEALPISADLRGAYPQEALALACGGGEDYQLLFAGREEALSSLRQAADVPLTIIGEMTDSPVHGPRLLDASGREIHLDLAGWEHFRPSERGA